MKDVTLNKVAICSNKKFREMIINHSHISDADKTIAVAYWETPALYYDIKKRYPDKDIYYIETEDVKGVYGDIENAIYVKSEEEFPNMHFDKVIMNPPYGGQSNLYIKLTSIAKDHANEVVCLSPTLDYYSNSIRTIVLNSRKNLSPYFNSYEKVSNKGFDAAFDKDLYILNFKNTNLPISFDELKFDRFNDANMAKIIYTKFCNYSSSLRAHILTDFTKFPFNCYYSHIRGHRNQETGKLSWDWTTIFPNIYRNEFTKYVGNANKIYSFGFNTKVECKNFINYCDTDVFMFGVYLFKKNFNQDPSVFEHLPCMPTYTKAWTDEEIATELGLTDEEVAYIHEEMKDFGYKAMKKEK